MPVDFSLPSIWKPLNEGDADFGQLNDDGSGFSMTGNAQQSSQATKNSEGAALDPGFDVVGQENIFAPKVQRGLSDRTNASMGTTTPPMMRRGVQSAPSSPQRNKGKKSKKEHRNSLVGSSDFDDPFQPLV